MRLSKYELTIIQHSDRYRVVHVRISLQYFLMETFPYVVVIAKLLKALAADQAKSYAALRPKVFGLAKYGVNLHILERFRFLAHLTYAIPGSRTRFVSLQRSEANVLTIDPKRLFRILFGHTVRNSMPFLSFLDSDTIPENSPHMLCESLRIDGLIQYAVIVFNTGWIRGNDIVFLSQLLRQQSLS